MGTSPVAVFHAAEAIGLHPFFICVGREAEPCRIRRVTFHYDASSYSKRILLGASVTWPPGVPE